MQQLLGHAGNLIFTPHILLYLYVRIGIGTLLYIGQSAELWVDLELIYTELFKMNLV